VKTSVIEWAEEEELKKRSTKSWFE